MRNPLRTKKSSTPIQLRYRAAMNTWAMPPDVAIRLRLCGTTRRIAIAQRPSKVGKRAGRETGCAGAGIGELMTVGWTLRVSVLAHPCRVFSYPWTIDAFKEVRPP